MRGWARVGEGGVLWGGEGEKGRERGRGKGEAKGIG